MLVVLGQTQALGTEKVVGLRQCKCIAHASIGSRRLLKTVPNSLPGALPSHQFFGGGESAIRRRAELILLLADPLKCSHPLGGPLGFDLVRVSYPAEQHPSRVSHCERVEICCFQSPALESRHWGIQDYPELGRQRLRSAAVLCQVQAQSAVGGAHHGCWSPVLAVDLRPELAQELEREEVLCLLRKSDRRSERQPGNASQIDNRDAVLACVGGQVVANPG